MRLPFASKLAYGVGQVAEGIKTRGFDVFVFFYFNQVLGLEGWMTGLAIAVALVFDAVTDPVAGSISDHWNSPRGRRHPFMYASAAPLGIFWFLLFFPPDGLGSWGLFAWLATFAVLVRGAMTLYHVPHMALGAEMTEDYQERTSVVAYRNVLGTVGGVGTTVLALRLFFPEAEGYANPLLNPSGYPSVAAFGALLMFGTIWISAFGTRSVIPRLPKPPANPEPFSFRRVFRELRGAWGNASFRALFVGFSLYAVSSGMHYTLGTHINVFFWGFGPDEAAVVTAALIPGFALGALFARGMHRRFDKRPTLLIAATVSPLFGVAGVVLRFLGWFPENGSPLLLPLVCSFTFAMALIGAWGMISAGSMMADVAQEYELQAGEPKQGIFLSASSFAGKLASGGGHLLAGLGISLIAFPVQETDPSAVAPFLLQRLGILNLLAFSVAPVVAFSFTFYRIDRSRYAEIIDALEQRRHAARSAAPAR